MRARRAVGVLGLGLLLLGAPSEAARQFNGTTQSLQSAASVDLTAYSKVAISLWLWVDTFANDNKFALEHGNPNFTAGNGSFIIAPNDAPSAAFLFGVGGNVANSLKYVARPSGGAWHHWVINLDKSKASNEVDSAWLDGVSQTLTAFSGGDNTNTFATGVIYVMSRINASGFLAGRQAELALWGGLLLGQSDVNALYNSGLGGLATNVQPASLVLYCRLLGLASPEPCLIGGTTFTINGAAPGVTHPFLDATPAVSRRPARKFGR